MPELSAFRGLRYSGPLADLTSPPYDVIDPEQRSALAARHRHNAVHIDLPAAAQGEDPYEAAAARLRRWIEEGVLRRDPEPVLYGYRMSFTDPSGAARRTTGVLGALRLSRAEEGEILPHEHTTPKARSDRLQLLRASRANLSAIWGLSPAGGLTSTIGEPPAEAESWVDEGGVTHTFWVISEPERIRRICQLASQPPVLIADGHHRYETSLAYRDELRTESAEGSAGEAEATLVYLVELVEDELTVLPIHRLIEELPGGIRPADVLASAFEIGEDLVLGPELGESMRSGGFLVLVEPERIRALRPRRPDASGEPDTGPLDAALADATLRYQHGISETLSAVRQGEALAGVLVRPATVAQIAATADRGRRMPPKTTFFHPKPRTGLVYRPLD